MIREILKAPDAHQLKKPHAVIRGLLACLFIALLTAPAMAQFPGSPGGQRGGPPPQAERVKAELVLKEGVARPGERVHLGVILTMQPNWKIQAGLGSGDVEDPYIPTRFELTLPDGWTEHPVHWPEASTFTLEIGDFKETLKGYLDTTLAAIPLDIPEDAEPAEYSIEAKVHYQACDDTQCLMPTSTNVKMTVRVVAEDWTGEVTAIDDDVRAMFDHALSRTAYDADADDVEDDASDKQPVATEATGPTFFGWRVPSLGGVGGVMLLALFAAIGGFVLNLTPCVLPVIPIKVMTIMQHANKPGKNLVLGTWMALGVIAFWVGIGLPVALFAGITDPSRLFGIWWLTMGIGLLIAFMGIGIMGMFTIQLPQSAYAINPKADTAWGSFLFGIMTAILGLPCFGFVAGALLAGAATMPASTIMIIFTSLGIGMALPYFVLSAKPSLVEKLPRTGPASELVKQVMGLLLLAAAAYFIGSGMIALVNDAPYLARQLHWWAVALFAAVSGLWLIVRTFQISSNLGPRVSFSVIGLIIAGAAVVYASNSTLNARSNWEARQAALADADGTGYVTGYWNDYTPSVFEQARNDDRIILLDFTAEWCINCKALKAAVLDRDPVRSQLAEPDVVKFTVDLTSTRAQGWEFLNELGHTGIPLLVIYTPGKEQPWESNAYTSQQVMAALEQARTHRDDTLAQR